MQTFFSASSQIIVSSSWGQVLLTAIVTVFVFAVSQLVLVHFYKRDEHQRLDPFFVECCSRYIAALDRVRAQIASRSPLDQFEDYEHAEEMLELIAPDGFHLVMEQSHNVIYSILNEYKGGHLVALDALQTQLGQSQMQMVQLIRQHFGYLPRRFRASPRIMSDDVRLFGLLEGGFGR